jgi:2-haloacid dehalogenase
LEFDRLQAITFDCYGTLIDWESGLLAALRPVLQAHGKDLSDTQILEIYGELEPRAQSPYQLYRHVLADVVRGFAQSLGFTATDAEADSLAESLQAWLPFPDTNEALERLKRRYRLAIISNTDDDLFAGTARHFTVKFDEIITAQRAKAYKPSLAPFRLALEKLHLSAGQVLHAGQSVYHDVLPAKFLGIPTVLVERRGFGATRPTEGEPDLRVPDLHALASLAQQTGRP